VAAGGAAVNRKILRKILSRPPVRTSAGQSRSVPEPETRVRIRRSRKIWAGWLEIPGACPYHQHSTETSA